MLPSSKTKNHRLISIITARAAESSTDSETPPLSPLKLRRQNAITREEGEKMRIALEALAVEREARAQALIGMVNVFKNDPILSQHPIAHPEYLQLEVAKFLVGPSVFKCRK